MPISVEQGKYNSAAKFGGAVSGLGRVKVGKVDDGTTGAKRMRRFGRSVAGSVANDNATLWERSGNGTVDSGAEAVALSVQMFENDCEGMSMAMTRMVDLGSGVSIVDPMTLADYSIDWDDVLVQSDDAAVEAMATEQRTVTEKFDTACSRTISGVTGRIKVTDVEHSIVIKGFNDAQSKVDKVGINDDGVTEYYVSGMPDNLVLLSANDYVRGGAAVLFHDGGTVYSLSGAEEQQLRSLLSGYSVKMNLRVRNHTYEVDRSVVEPAYASTNYFNTRVNVATKGERVLVYLLTGLSLRDLQKAIKDQSVTGFHPELDMQALSNFERKYGRSPDVLQLALPNRMGNVKGYMTEPRKVSRCGELVEMDNMESDFLEGDTSDDVSSPDKNLLLRKNRRKLPTHGGAVAANVTYDVYSGFVHGRLLKSLARAVDCVRAIVDIYATARHPIAELAADRGIIHQGKFKVDTPEVVAYLQEQHIAFHGAEPYNHANGTPHVERIIGVIKGKMRMAMQYILRNPNLKYLGFTTQQVLQLWGEIFYWAVTVINLKESPNVPGKTRYEVFTGRVPNIQEVRLLPIFSVLMVLREEPNAAAVDGANRSFYQYGLYVGPDQLVTGGIRVAVLTNKRLQIVTSSRYKCVTDGGSLNSYPQVQRGLRRLLEETNEEEEEQATVPDQHPASSLTPVPGVSPAVTEAEPVVLPATDASATSTSLETAVEVGGDGASGQGVQQPAMSGKGKKRTRKPRERKEVDMSKWKTREERFMARQRAHAKYAEHGALYAEDCPDGVLKDSRALYNACFADWSTVASGIHYYSMMEAAFYAVSEAEWSAELKDKLSERVESGYRAVTVGVPRTYLDALKDPEWGEPARKEWNTMMETRAIVEVNADAAKKAIAEGADLVVLFPVYEVKEKEGKMVRKVRLVGDGRTHYNATNTYAGTPGRDELLVLLHVIAAKGWDFVHVDEVRAFLNAEYKGERKVFAKLKHGSEYYQVLKALYGLRTSPRDYQEDVMARLKTLGFHPLALSPHLQVLRCEKTGAVTIVFMWVDDFIITGNSREAMDAMVAQFRTLAVTTEPVINPTKVLGLELKRDWAARTICVSMPDRIRELAVTHDCTGGRVRHVPIPQSGYKVRDYQFDELEKGMGELLGKAEVAKYMQIVGSLIWLTGVRLDIMFATTYLAWFTKEPRKHHLAMALHCVEYLYQTLDIPLVLGGEEKIGAKLSSDASLGTGPKCRSISAVFARLGARAGGVLAKSTAAHMLSLSSFESELDAFSRAVKVMMFLYNLLESLGIEQERPTIECDNQAMINFVKGEGAAKGVRHMELRMWYVREQYQTRKYDVFYTSGKVLSADKFTKLGDRNDHQEFLYDVQGLGLLRSTTGESAKQDEDAR